MSESASHHSLQVGEIEVVALADGWTELPSSLFGGAEPHEVATLSAGGGFDPGAIPTALNCFLIRSGGRNILVDTGGGENYSATAGRLQPSLGKLGLAAADIDLVLLTHLHRDHVGGLLDEDGQPVFRNAEVRLAETEAAFWLDGGVPPDAPARIKAGQATALEKLAPYRGRTTRFDDGETVAPGVTAVALPGHTPGHSGFLIASGGERLLIWADIVHVPAFQFPHPEWQVGFDVNGPQAVETRRSAFARASSEALRVAGMHIAFPGIGWVFESDGHYRFEPDASR
jgi:glyoxylase-like metal-dependent hydrolase (beta-lactamase superfamily II)